MTSQSQPTHRKTSILTRWPTAENPSAIYQAQGQQQQQQQLYQQQQQYNQQLQQQPTYHPQYNCQPHWLPPVDYDDDEEEEDDVTPSSSHQQQQPSASVDADDRSLEFQQQQALSLEERQNRRKISLSNITGKVKIPSRRRSVMEFRADFHNTELQATAAAGPAAARQNPQTVPK